MGTLESGGGSQLLLTKMSHWQFMRDRTRLIRVKLAEFAKLHTMMKERESCEIEFDGVDQGLVTGKNVVILSPTLQLFTLHMILVVEGKLCCCCHVENVAALHSCLSLSLSLYLEAAEAFLC
jgi:hypothetical protein